jgi:RNA polymerase sigma factor for flagellar operon FliA
MRLKTVAPAEPAERDALVLAHVDLVRSMANRLSRRLPAHVENAELVTVGVLGLIDAATRYQPGLGVPFDAFARRRIHGAMLDALRGLDRVPRSVRRQQRDVEGAMSRLRHLLGREPEAGEIAAALGLPIDAYERRLDDIRSADLGVLRSASPFDDDDPVASLIELAIDGEPGPYAQLERRELRAELARALVQLPDRERQILALSYGEELTLAEIGQVIGVGESRVSQLRSQAVARLRSLLQEWLRESRAA